MSILFQIEEYFSQLPPGKVPRLGTPGERFRDRQVATQLPKQDLALTYCAHVDKGQAQSYEDFVAARNEIALDVAHVTRNSRTDTVISQREQKECF